MNELSGRQKIFIAVCKSLDIPTEQIAICLCLLDDTALDEILHWIAHRTKEMGRLLTIKELMDYLHGYILQHHLE